MKLKPNLLVVALILGMVRPALAAPESPVKTAAAVFENLQPYKGADPKAEQVAAAQKLLLSLLDEAYLKTKLLTGIVPVPSAEQQDLLFTTISEQLTIGTLKGIQKSHEREDYKKPEASEIITENGAKVIYDVATKHGQRQIECQFYLVQDKYLLRDVLLGKKSMVNIFQKRLKKELKKMTVEEYVAKLKKMGFEMKSQEQ